MMYYHRTITRINNSTRAKINAAMQKDDHVSKEEREKVSLFEFHDSHLLSQPCTFVLHVAQCQAAC